MPKDKIKNVEATNGASPRSRKAGQQAQDEFTDSITRLVKNLEKAIQLEVEPNVIITDIGHNKKNKKKLN